MSLPSALLYASHGFGVVPIKPGEKSPSISDWVNAATTDHDQLRRWFTQWPGHGVGIATGPASGVFVFDIDVGEGKHGDETLYDLEQQYGKLPETVRVITGSGGLHLYFRYPQGLDWELRNSADKLGPGLDIRGAGGQVLAPPTLHPITGRGYEFEAGYGLDEIEIAEAPEWLLELLKPVEGEGEAGPRPTAAHTAVGWDHFNLSCSTAQVVEFLVAAGWKLIRHRGEIADLLRPGKDYGISGTVSAVNPGVFYCFTPNAPGFDAQRAYSPARVMSITMFDGDDVAADEALVAAGWGCASMSRNNDVEVAAYIAEANEAAEAEFWSRRPFLEHVRAAAHSRYVSADAVLGACLARVASLVPPQYLIPPTVGSPATLASYVALVGPPGTAKSSSIDIACQIIEDPGFLGSKDRVSPSSGEGLIEAYMGTTKEENEEGKMVPVRKQVRDRLYCVLDEGSLLGKISARQGSTIMDYLRIAWSGAPLTTQSATDERNRYVPAKNYSLGLVMNLQPAMAGPLLDDIFGGLPQRFLWVSASDGTIPVAGAPVWPGPWPWVPPAELMETSQWFQLPEEVVTATRELHVTRQRQALINIADDIDAHRMLLRTKVAALLAIVERRLSVTLDDWELARMVLERSDVVRSQVRGYIHSAELEEKTLVSRARTEARVKEAVQVEEAKEQHAVERVAKVVLRRVRKDAAETTAGEIRRAVASRDRELLEEAIEFAVKNAWISQQGDGYVEISHGE